MSNQMQKSQVYQDGKTGDMGLNGQPTVGVNIQGVIVSGYLTPQISQDGDNWTNIPVLDVAGVAHATITAAGSYRADVNGYVTFRLNPTSIVTTNLTIQYFTFPQPMFTQSVEAIPMQTSETLTLTGCTTAPTSAAKSNTQGNQVSLEIPAVTATSNSTACTLTGLSAPLWPATAQTVPVNGIEDNGVVYAAGVAVIGTNGVITLKFNPTAILAPTATFTNTGTKGWTLPLTLNYLISP